MHIQFYYYITKLFIHRNADFTVNYDLMKLFETARCCSLL